MSNNKKKYDPFKKITIISFFIICSIIILLIYPNEKKFKYEFQNGKPWLHENLIAPFDFAINKTLKEIDDERDSIIRNFKPYYKIDSKIFFEKLNKFSSEFESYWIENTNLLFKNDEDSVIINNENINLQNIKKKTLNKFSNIISQIYNKGIIDSTILLKEENYINVLNNNYSEQFLLNNIYTSNSAIEYLKKTFKSDSTLLKNEKDIINKLLTNINFNTILVPNLVPDNENTKKIKENLINSISLTSGMIQENQKIITKGEIVNTEKYRILNSLKKEFETTFTDKDSLYLLSIGQLILIMVSLLILYMFLRNFRKDLLTSYTKVLFLLMIIIIFNFVTTITLQMNVIHYYLIPYALIPIIIRTFYDTRLALFIHLITVFLIAVITPNPFEFVYLQFLTGAVAIFSLANIQKRSQLFFTALIIFVTYSILFFGISLLQEGSIDKIYWKNFIWFAGNGLLLLSAYPLIYIFEKIFGFLSDVTLMELSDINHPILRNLAKKAPGTFQHSIQVANFAEEIAFQIGGNSLLVRVGALYHDIGKMENPAYFIENQRSGNNPHDNLDCEESAKIIINHVNDGMNIANKYKIPNQVKEFIRTHHGISKVQYFYRTYMANNPDKDCDVNKFMYPGILPFMKEHAIVMMADAVEAASRSIKDVSEQKINDLIESIIDFQIRDNQFINTDLTFKDILKSKQVLKEKLLNVFHVRIEYPKAVI